MTLNFDYTTRELYPMSFSLLYRFFTLVLKTAVVGVNLGNNLQTIMTVQLFPCCVVPCLGKLFY